jgi:hypothetical protein
MHDATALASRIDRLPDSRLKRIVAEFGIGDRKASVFRNADRAALLARLERMQRQTPRTSALYRYLTFTLAYFGHDYRGNARRLLHPVELWERRDPRYDAYVHHGFPGEPEPIEDVPELLVRLYERNHDRALLTSVFSMTLDGGPAEGLSAERVQLLTEHPSACLKSLQHSRDLTANAEEDFDLASPEEYAHAEASIKGAARRGDPPLRHFASRLLSGMAAARRRVEVQNRPHSGPGGRGVRAGKHRGE